MVKFYSAVAGIALLGIIAFTTVMGGWFTVDQGEVGLVLRNRSIQSVEGPGWHLKAPWLDDVHKFSIRSDRYKWDTPIQAFSKDIQTVDFTLSVNLRVAPEAVPKIYTTFGTEYVSRAIFPQVPVALKDVAGKYTAPDLISKRGQFADQFLARLRERVPPEFIVDSVQIENIDFSDNFERSIEAAAEMNAQAEKARNELAKSEAEAKITVVNAQAQADSAKAAGDAQAHVITVQGEAEASAIKAKAEALRASPELVQLTIAQKWDGTLPVNMYANSPVPLLNLKQ